MSKKGSPWTPEEEIDLLEGLRKGHSFETMARFHQRSLKAVEWRFGLYCKKHLHELDKISNEFHVDLATIHKILDDLNASKSNIVETIPSPKSNSKKMNVECTCKQDILQLHQKMDKQYSLLKKLILQVKKNSFKKK